MKMLDAQDVQRLIEALGGGSNAEARTALVREIRENHSKAIADGEIAENTPAAAVYSLDELEQRGLTSKGKHGRRSALRASKTGAIRLARTLDDDQVLVVLNEDDGEDGEDA